MEEIGRGDRGNRKGSTRGLLAMMSRKKTRRKRRLWKGRSPDKERVPGVEKEEGGGKEVNAYGEQEEEKRELIRMIMITAALCSSI